MSTEFENKRVEELINYEIMDSVPDPELDEITKLAMVMCETSISLVTLLDHSRMLCISKQGIEISELPKEKSICQFAIQQQDLFIVHDILKEETYDMVQLPGMRFYAGMPLVTSNGYNIGALCVMDKNPKILADNQKFLLKALAKQVITKFELRKKNKELLKLNGRVQIYKEKEQFFSNMSHELRTPLNAISGFTDLLSKTKLDKNQREHVRILKSSIEILIHIINDLLDYSKIESGNFVIEKHSFNLRTLIKPAYELFKAKAQEKNIFLIVDVCKTVPSFINGDMLRLNQILINLLGNAIKFTNKGSVALKINMSKETKKEVKLDFSVKDTGIGIPKDKLKEIFERFHQIEGTTRVFGGSGLGLSIVKSLVELQGGTIEARSELGKYSEFCFSIIYQKSSQKEISNFIKEETTKVLSSKLDFKGLRILLAEDVFMNVKLIQKIFEGTGIDLDISHNGKVCIEKLKLKNYDFILMDMFMPEMDGCEATQYIRNSMQLNIPIIAMSANISELSRKKCLDAGMNDYISKPFKIDELFTVISKFVKKDDKRIEEKNKFKFKNFRIMGINKSKLEPLNNNNNMFHVPLAIRNPIKIPLNKKLTFNITNHAKNILPKLSRSNSNYIQNSNLRKITFKLTQKSKFEKIDFASLKEFLGKDLEFEKEMIDAFLQEVPECLKDLEAVILKENYDAIKTAAHKLKSPMGIFSLNILKSKFEEIEKLSQKSEMVSIKKLMEFCKFNLSKIFDQLRNYIKKDTDSISNF